MDAKIMENEAKIRANVRNYRDLKAVSMSKGVAKHEKSKSNWPKDLNHAIMMIIGRLE